MYSLESLAKWLAKWLSVSLRTKWFWVGVQLQSQRFIILLDLLISYIEEIQYNYYFFDL